MLRLRPLLALVAALVLAAPATALAAPLELGYFDPKVAADFRDDLLRDARTAGAQWQRVTVDWAGVADSRPADRADPGDPAYFWDATDEQVAAAERAGQKILLSFNRAPPWAEGPNRPSGVLRGMWRPDPEETGLFARALARRYRGRATAYQVWNEPNIYEYLEPQWTTEDGRLVPFAARHYRAMLNAAAAGIHAADPGAPVVSAGLSPLGEEPGGRKTRPVTFWREVVAEPVSLDVVDLHPYQYFGPLASAVHPEDAGVPDVGRISWIVEAAARQGRVRHARPLRYWVSEFSWDSGPPDPRGIPVEVHARWLAFSLFSLWRQGVDTVLWFQVRDEASVPFRFPFQSGTHYADGRPKPAARAFRFPLVTAAEPRGRAQRAWGRSRAAVQLWTRAPAAGRLVVERRTARGWRPVLRRRVAAGEVLHRRLLRLEVGTIVRARVEGQISLPWTVGRERLR